MTERNNYLEEIGESFGDTSKLNEIYYNCV